MAYEQEQQDMFKKQWCEQWLASHGSPRAQLPVIHYYCTAVVIRPDVDGVTIETIMYGVAPESGSIDYHAKHYHGLVCAASAKHGDKAYGMVVNDKKRSKELYNKELSQNRAAFTIECGSVLTLWHVSHITLNKKSRTSLCFTPR